MEGHGLAVDLRGVHLQPREVEFDPVGVLVGDRPDPGVAVQRALLGVVVQPQVVGEGAVAVRAVPGEVAPGVVRERPGRVRGGRGERERRRGREQGAAAALEA
ncbi:hypothetical protein GCM10020000_14640 [Streptomyces olivoverticillatus]